MFRIIKDKNKKKGVDWNKLKKRDSTLLDRDIAFYKRNEAKRKAKGHRDLTCFLKDHKIKSGNDMKGKKQSLKAPIGWRRKSF